MSIDRDVTARALEELPAGARMDAYYYGFDRTGIGAVDLVLSAVATAGKGSHHTQTWGDPWEKGEQSNQEKIQAAAVDAAALVRELVEAIEYERERCRTLKLVRAATVDRPAAEQIKDLQGTVADQHDRIEALEAENERLRASNAEILFVNTEVVAMLHRFTDGIDKTFDHMNKAMPKVHAAYARLDTLNEGTPE